MTDSQLLRWHDYQRGQEEERESGYLLDVAGNFAGCYVFDGNKFPLTVIAAAHE